VHIWQRPHFCIAALQGFLRSWVASGFCDKVVHRISEIVAGLKKDKHRDVRIFVTGDGSCCNAPASACPCCCIAPHCTCV
jgi:hypothetical protein